MTWYTYGAYRDITGADELNRLQNVNRLIVDASHYKNNLAIISRLLKYYITDE